MLSVSKNHWIVTRRKEPSMVDEEISNRQKGWKTTGDVIHHFPIASTKKKGDDLLDTERGVSL